jgi:hypothetical protein
MMLMERKSHSFLRVLLLVAVATLLLGVIFFIPESYASFGLLSQPQSQGVQVKPELVEALRKELMQARKELMQAHQENDSLRALLNSSPNVPVDHSLGKEGFTWPAHARVGVVNRIATERPGFTTFALSLSDLMYNLYSHNNSILHGVFVNVGAADGCLTLKKECDEANELLPLHDLQISVGEVRARNKELYEKVAFRGILFEPGDTTLLSKSYAVDSFTVVPISLDYARSVEAFVQANVPLEFDFLKFDTDGPDCDSIDTILSGGYLPSLIMAEFNIVFPPPLRFNQLVTPGNLFQWGRRGPHMQQLGVQCSLSHLSDRMAVHGYTLIQVDWWDAFYVRDHLVEAATGGAPVYSDLTWFLHGYVTNADSNSARLKFLKKTAYAAAAEGVVEQWVQTIASASRAGSSQPLNPQQYIEMRTAMWWLAAQEGYVQVKDVNLIGQRGVCHDGCIPQPFSLA